MTALRHWLEAHRDLWTRYGSTFAYFWRHRDQMRSQLLLEDEAQFLPTALAVQEAPASRTARWVAWLIMSMVLLAFAWAFVGRMDIVVNAQGKVIPSSRIQTIASVDTGAIVMLGVHDGQRVKTGDLLLQLDSRAIDAERDKALSDKGEAALTGARNLALLSALTTGRPPRMPTAQQLEAQYQVHIEPAKWEAAQRHVQGQFLDYSSKQQKFADDIGHYRQMLPLVARQAESYRMLAATQDVSRDAWQEKEQARLQLQAQLQEARNQQAALLAETKKNALDQIAEARRTAAESGHDAVRAASTSGLLTLRAPVDGTVQQLAVHTIGGVAQAAQPLMQIVPAGGPLEIEAFMENKDKGFVHAGQSVAVKVDAFEYTKYGTLPGKVTHVSQDAIPDEKRGLIYAVKVLLDETMLDVEGEPTPVTPGMAVNVEIKTGDRRVIEYVMSPLIRHTREALHER